MLAISTGTVACSGVGSGPGADATAGNAPSTVSLPGASLNASRVQSQSTSDREQILSTIHAWLASVQSGDRAKLEQLLHPSFIEISPGGEVSSRDNALSLRPPAG